MTVEPSLIFSSAVFLLVFLVVGAAGLRLLSARSAARGADAAHVAAADRAPASRAALLNGRVLAAGAECPRDGLAGADGPGAKRPIGPRRILGAILRGLSWLIVGFLVTVTIASYFAATPGDGSILLTWVLAIVTLMAAAHFHKLNRRYRTTEADAAWRAEFVRDAQADLAGKVGAALTGMKVQWDVGPPEVHSIDAEALARARAALAGGKSIDEVCRTVDPGYDGRSAPHRQALQSVMRAALEHRG